MPQLDFYSFTVQLFWTLSFFFISYFFFKKYYLPKLARVLKARSKLIVKYSVPNKKEYPAEPILKLACEDALELVKKMGL